MNFFDLKSTTQLSDTIKVVLEFANLHTLFAENVLKEKYAKEVKRRDANKNILLSH